MPQNRERKREYNRERQRIRRGFYRRRRGGFLGGVVPDVVPSIDTGEPYVVPGLYTGNVVPWAPPWHLEQGPARRVLEYIRYLNTRGFSLYWNGLGYELVDVTTGEVSPCGAVQQPIYEQRPTTRTLRERVAGLESRITQLEADLALWEAQGLGVV